jgi:hypothetical protein
MRLYKKIFQVLMIGLTLSSCKKQLDTNLTDPNGVGINALTGKDVFAQALFGTAANKSGFNINAATGDNYDYVNNWMGYWARTTSFAPSGVQEQYETFTLNNSFADGVWASVYHNIFDYSFVIAHSSAGSICPALRA